MRERSRKQNKRGGAGQGAGSRYKTSRFDSSPRQAAESGRGAKSPSEPSLDLAPRAVGSLFRTARESMRLTQEQLAALVSERPWQVSRAEIGAIERGRHLPGLVTLIGLSQALHL